MSTPGNLREALEMALVEAPDDLATYRAYADLLSEQGDPRGELAQIQLALEGPCKGRRREELERREKELLEAHGSQWLGELAPTLAPEVPPAEPEWLSLAWRKARRSGFQFARGWLDTVRIRELTVEQARALARSPAARLLRRLLVFGTTYYGDAGRPGEPSYEPDEQVPAGLDWPQFRPLAHSPYLANVRYFYLGEPLRSDGDADNCHTDAERVVEVVRRMPRLEELHLLAHRVDTDALFRLGSLVNLRVLRVYHATHYPLRLLAANPALANLTRLLLHPHALEGGAQAYIRLPAVRELLRSPHLKSLTHLQLRLSDMGDSGCKAIVKSGILKRLKWLDLRHGCITDAGALTLAACNDLDRLAHLDVRNNSLTQEGIDELRAILPHVQAEGQHGAGDVPNLYLFEGDME